MKIVISGASTFGVKNAGDDAMFWVLCNGLKKKIPKLEIIFVARHPDKSFDKIFGVNSIKNIDHYNNKESVGRWFFGFNPGDPTKHLKKLRHALQDAELVILGGNSFMEISSNSFMRGVSSYSALLATWARLFGKPFVLYGVHGHTLNNELTKQMARFLCNNASLVTVREQFFKNELKKAGVKSKNLQVLSDPAFGLKPITSKVKGKNILEKEGIILKSHNLVGICFRHMYWLWNKKQFDHYASKMAKLCDFMIKKLGTEIIFIPNCTYKAGNQFEDDRTISEYVWKKMKLKKNAHIIKKDWDLPDRLSIYPLLDFVITNRRHVAIFAAVHGIPFISLSTGHLWQFKPFMQELGMSNYLIDFVDESLEAMKNKIKSAWCKRKKVSKKINKRIPAIRSRSRKQVELIADLIS